MHASGYVVLLAGLPQYVRAAVVGDLAVELNTAVPSISDGVLAEGESLSKLHIRTQF
jgi:hypothetical protein